MPLSTAFRALNRVPTGWAAASARTARAFGMGSHVPDNDPAVLAREMTKAMEGHTPTAMPGTPGWNEKVSSDSEAIVKAERAAAEEGGQDVAADVKVLVKHTVTVLREEAFIDRMVGEGVPEREKK